jgi:hypothetical protein
MVIVRVPQLIGRPAILPGGALRVLSTDADGGALLPGDLPNFQAQASTNLMNWVSLPGALGLTNGALLLTDLNRTNYPVKFYRIIEQ